MAGNPGRLCFAASLTDLNYSVGLSENANFTLARVMVALRADHAAC
jgi:hypothetical protein